MGQEDRGNYLQGNLQLHNIAVMLPRSKSQATTKPGVQCYDAWRAEKENEYRNKPREPISEIPNHCQPVQDDDVSIPLSDLLERNRMALLQVDRFPVGWVGWNMQGPVRERADLRGKCMFRAFSELGRNRKWSSTCTYKPGDEYSRSFQCLNVTL